MELAPRSNPKVSIPPWLELPKEITTIILFKVGAIDILSSVQRVCRTWRYICRDASMWRSIVIRDKWTWNLNHWVFLDTLCRQALELSLGLVTDITLDYFASNDLLSHIAQRCSQLKRLRLSDHNRITEEDLTQTVRCLPLLEELQLDYTGISLQAIKDVGIHCLNFKSLKLTTHRYRPVSDQEAQAIGKYMPELCNLQLIGSTLTNKGLQVILDGCPYLESLDLRQCFSVDLGGKFGTMCSQRVKHLKGPNDPYIEFDADFIDYESSDSEDCNVAEWIGY